MRAVLPWSGPVMDRAQGKKCLTPWNTLAVPWGSPSTCNKPGRMLLGKLHKQGGRTRATPSDRFSFVQHQALGGWRGDPGGRAGKL